MRWIQGKKVGISLVFSTCDVTELLGDWTELLIPDRSNSKRRSNGGQFWKKKMWFSVTSLNIYKVRHELVSIFLWNVFMWQNFIFHHRIPLNWNISRTKKDFSKIPKDLLSNFLWSITYQKILFHRSIPWSILLENCSLTGLLVSHFT